MSVSSAPLGIRSKQGVKRPLTPRFIQSPALRWKNVDKLLIQIRERKSQLGARSFLDMIPAEYRDAVIAMADRAFPEKGAGRPIEEFRETMALNWLAKKEAFELMSKEAGFTPVEYASAMQPAGIIAFTTFSSTGVVAELSKYICFIL